MTDQAEKTCPFDGITECSEPQVICDGCTYVSEEKRKISDIEKLKALLIDAPGYGKEMIAELAKDERIIEAVIELLKSNYFEVLQVDDNNGLRSVTIKEILNHLAR